MMSFEPETLVAPHRLAGLAETARRRRAVFYAKTDSPLPDEVLRRLSDKDDELEPTAVALAPVCREALGVEPVEVTPLGSQGTFHALYRVRLLDDMCCVLRANRLSHLYRDYALHIDRWAADVLTRHDLPAVPVYTVDLTRRWFPFDCALMGEATGTPLRQFDEDNALTAEVLEALGTFLARLHGIRAEGFGPVDIEPIVRGEASLESACGVFDSWRDYVWLNLEEHLRRCHDIGVISPVEQRRILAHFVRAEAVFEDVMPVLLHGDPGSHNIFSDGHAITAAVDWEDCLAGDPLYEIAFWGTFHPDERLEPFLVGYRAVRRLPDDFARRYWLYYLRVSLAKTVHRSRFNYADRPGREPASRRIQKGLRRLDSLLGV